MSIKIGSTLYGETNAPNTVLVEKTRLVDYELLKTKSPYTLEPLGINSGLVVTDNIGNPYIMTLNEPNKLLITNQDGQLTTITYPIVASGTVQNTPLTVIFGTPYVYSNPNNVSLNLNGGTGGASIGINQTINYLNKYEVSVFVPWSVTLPRSGNYIIQIAVTLGTQDSLAAFASYYTMSLFRGQGTSGQTITGTEPIHLANGQFNRISGSGTSTVNVLTAVLIDGAGTLVYEQ